VRRKGLAAVDDDDGVAVALPSHVRDTYFATSYTRILVETMLVASSTARE
jgi:hypothetical protein